MSARRLPFTRETKSGYPSSCIKTNPENLFPDDLDFQAYDTLILVDAVVAKGTTLCDHLNQVPDSFQGEIMIISNVTAHMGAVAIADTLREKNMRGLHLTGRVVADENCVMKIIDGKPVLIVGLGDIGEAVSHEPRPIQRRMHPGRHP